MAGQMFLRVEEVADERCFQALRLQANPFHE